MKNTTKLPEGYEEIYKIDLKNDKKKAMFIHITVFVIAILMIVIGMIFVPIKNLFDLSDGAVVYYGRFFVIIIGVLLSLFLQNLIVGICMKCIVKTKLHSGLARGFSYIGSNAYFSKKSYIFVGFSPFIIVIALLIIICLVGTEWFWSIYFIQVGILSSLFSHIYVTYKLSKFPKNILIKDNGLSMTVYSNTHN